MTSTVDPGPVRARAGWAWPAVAGLLLLATLAPEPAHAQTGICGRTKVVRDALVALIPGVSHCASVTAAHLAAITGELNLAGMHGEHGAEPTVTALAAGDFDGLTSLDELSLGTNGLTTLPATVFDDLTALTDLSLEQNRLTGLPDGVFDNLTALTSLGLRDNQVLTELPDGVFDNLTALKTLLLRGNGMTELVAGMFDNLTALTLLVLAVNELTELPDGVFDDLTALIDLDLADNELTELPDGVFDNLTALRDLDLGNNELTELPDGVFENLTALTELSLARSPGAPFAPTADALPDDGKVPVAGGTVTLDGSGSGGAWGTNVTHSWALTNPPSGVTVTFDDSTSATPMVTIPALTTGTELTFTLTVTGRGTTSRYSYGGAPGTDTATVTVSPAGTLLLTLDAIAGDNTVNIAEKAAGFSIGGATGTESGVSVTVTVGSTTLAAATSATGGAWSVAVPAAAAYLTGISVTVTVSASKTGYTPPGDVTRALAVDLTAPSATYTAPSSLQVGVAVGAMTPSTTDTDIASYGVTGLPPGLSIDSMTGAISGTPDTADANTADATVTVTDTAGNTATVDITFPAVAKGEQTLTGFAYSPASVTFGGAAPAVTAPGGVQTTLSYSATPATVCTVDASTGALTLVGVGACNITATAASSDDYNQGTATYTVTVAAAGTLALTLDTIAGDDTVNIAEKTAGFAISGDTGSEGGVSVTVTVGTTQLTATSDSGGAWSVAVPANAAYITGTNVAVTVSASKTGYTPPGDVTRALAVDLAAPSATYTAPSSLQVGVAVGAMTPSTTDTDIASYGATGLPPGLGIDSMTGAISGTPDTADANTAGATVTVTDTAGNTDTVSITFPAVAKGDQTLTGFAYSPASVTYGDTAPAVTAPGGVQTTLSYSATPATVCTVDASTGALTLVEVGSCVITATAVGTADYNEATAAFTVTVAAAGTLALTLDTIAGDDTVNIAEKAAGFAISGDTGSEGGVNVTVTVGSTPLTATSASGGAWSVDVPAGASYLTGTSVAVTVSASKTGYTPPGDVTRALAVDLAAPSATYTAPSSLQVGVAVGAMTPSTTDTDIASYGTTGLPPGLSIDSMTGAISGTPDTADANTAGATVTVTDTAGNTDTVDITFPAVAKGDQTLTGFAYSPATVTYGDTAPAVTAPGGVRTTLAYSAAPATVCTVAASTGALTLVEVGDCNITATAASSDDYNQGTATYTVTVAAAGALVLNLDTIAGDDTVNIAEKAAGFAISGDTGSEGGVSVTVTVGSTPLTATSDSGGAWSVDVPAGASYITGTGVAVTVSASKTGYTPPGDVTRALAVDLAAPSATYTAPSSLQVGVAVGAMTPSTTDTDIASYGATGLPPGLGIDSMTGAISGTPDTADANTADATVTVTDTAGNTDTVDITFPAVAKGDQTLTGFAYSPASVTFGGAAPAVTAPGGVQTTLAYSATPAAVCTVDASTGALTLAGVGNCNITATAAGAANYNEATAAFTVTVAAAGTLALTLDTIAGDDTVNIAEKAAGFAISGDTGSEGGVGVTVTVGGTELTATSASGGAWSVDVPAGASYIAGTSVAVTVSASKTGYTPPGDVTRTLAVDLTAPSATYTAPSSLQVGVAVGAMTPSTTDTDIASYGATGLPPGLGIDTGTGVIDGTPDTADANTAGATVTVTDTAGNTDTVDITFPAVAKGDQTLTGFAYSPATVTYGDTAPAVTAPGGVRTTLAYSAAPATVCTVAASTGALTLVEVGDCNITATAASSDDYNQGTATYTVTVAAAGALVLNLDTIAGDDTVNIAEKAAGFAISGDTGSEGGVSVTVTVGSTPLTATSDSGGAWSVDVPAGASYITGTGVAVTVSASKTGYTPPGDVTRALAVDLAAPSATYTAPSSLQVGVAVGAMTPSTTDTDIASYGATGLPPGLGIDSMTGAISGTPDTADANTAGATVTVTDTAGNTDTVDITFPAVAKGDQTLTGFAYSPASVTYGDTAPAVTAPGGVQTTLSYSATPATVCTVDASTGALTLVEVGSCVITATAVGTADYNEATAAFTVTVAAAGTLALTLDTIAGDDTVNIAEKAAGFAISGDTGSEGGVGVTVTVGGTELTATSASGGAWSVDVPAGASYLTGTSVAVTVSASKTGYTPPSDVTRALAVDLAAPSATYTAPSSLQVGVAVGAMTPSTTDTDIASYGTTGLPPGLSIDSMTGAISGTPDTADANTADATVTVTDTAGNTDTVDITFPAVAKGDQTLTGFAYSPASVTFGGAAPAVTAPGGVQTTLAYSATPAAVCTVDASTGALTLAGVGNCNITATAAGAANYNEATAAFTVTVAAAGTLALTLDTIAGDDTVNIAEKAAGFAISGDTGSEGGVGVTVTVGGTELTATSASGGAWSVDVPAGASYIAGTSVTVTVSASKTGYTAPGDVTRALAVDLTAPSATYTAPSSLQVGVAVGAMTPSTADTDIASYGATGLPPGLSIDSMTGAISGTPDTADANTADATVTVTDTAGNTDTVDITFPAVAKGDQTLTGFAYSPASVTFGGAAPAVTAPGGVQTTLAYSATPAAVCTVDASTGALTLAGVGNCNITATAAGAANYNEATAAFTVTVAAAGTLALTLDTIAGDDTVNIAEKAAGFAISGDTGSEGGVGVTVTVGGTELTATSASGGAWSVDVPAGASYITGTSVAVTVSASKTGYTAPSDVTRALAVDLTAPSATYTAPSSLQVGVAVGAMTPSTADTDIASYGATGLPPGLSIDSMTGAISGTPDTADANTADATVTVTDTAGNTDTVDITFPAVAKGDQTLTGFAYSPASVTFGGAAPAVTAPGGVQTTLAYSATPAAVCTVDASTGALTLAGVGNCNITATAAGAANYNEATAAFTVTVAAAGTLALTLDTIAGDDTVNIAEKAAGFAISGDTGSEGGVGVTVTVGGTELTATSASGGAWSVDVPAGASYLTGTSVTVTVSASKTGYTAPGDVTRALAVDLAAPSATYTAPSSLQVGVAVGAMTPSTADTDIASYGATGLPPGLSIDSMTGAISGTPDTADANTADATVTVTDTAGNTDTVSITFPAVAKGDQALTGFAYSPASVTFGGAAPAVTAPGGVQTTLAYSATPAAVCTVDASTGALTLAGVGNCNITATAAGAANYNEATAAFTVTVAAAGTLALTLDTIAGDDTVNIAEKAAGFAISGDTGSEGGVGVTVTVGGTELTATSASGGAWSVDVPAGASYITGTSVAVTVSASKTGYTAPSDVTRALAVDLTAPSATYTAPSSLQVGVAIDADAMTPSTTDTDIASYGATGLPPGLGIDTGTGVIGGTPDTADANTADATVTVTDTAGNTDTVDITFPAVARGDQTLTEFAYSSASVLFGGAAPTVTAPDGVKTTLSYSAAPTTVCTVDASTGALTLAGLGECAVTATAAGTANYNEATAAFTVTVRLRRNPTPTVRAPEGTAGVLEVSWTAEPSASEYEVLYWPADEDGSRRRRIGTTDRSVFIHPLESNTEYTVRVRAGNAEGWNDWSETVTARTGAPQSGRPVLTLHLHDDDSEITEGDRVRYRIEATNIRNFHDWGDPGMLGRVWLRYELAGDRHPPADVGSDTKGVPGCHDVPLMRVGLSPAQPDFTQTSATEGHWNLLTDPTPRYLAEYGPMTLSISGEQCGTRLLTQDPRNPDIGSPRSVCVAIADNGEGAAYESDPPGDPANLTEKPTYSCSGSPAGSPSRAVAPLTAAFADLPSSHEGTAFTFRLEFSEDVATSAADMRDHALTVTGGTVTDAARVDGRADLWSITVTPSGTGEILISLPPGRDCSEAGAVCTSDGRQLPTGLAQIVAGPVNAAATVPRITAVQVTSVPELERDTYGRGETIRFTVSFSAPVEVTGSPHFTFSLGNRGVARKVDAAYESGSGTAALVFGYVVQEGDEDNNGIFLVDGAALGRAGPVALDAGEAITAPGGGVDADLSSSERGTQRDHKVDGSRAPEGPTPPVEGPVNSAAAGAPTISGTPQVGEELTASTSDISDADGLENASFDYQWIRARADIRGATGSTYTAVDADEGERLKVRVRFTDDAGNAESLTSAATEAVAAPPPPLTAEFVDMPAEHDGESAFTLRIAFSEPLSWMNGQRLREDVVAVSGGRATSASRVNRRRDLWELTVEPDSLADVTVTLAAGAACGSPAAVCTKDGRALSNTISATVRGPVGISVADARVEEGEGAVLRFAVTLSRAASGTLTVDYATSDGSAHAGDDYRSASGTLSFGAGESSQRIEVAVLDDDHDEGEETLTLTLSNPSSGRLTDGEATGTIKNRDSMPRALLARFGRTAAVHVVEQVEERLEARREPGFEGRFAGRALRPGMEREMGASFLRRLGGLESALGGEGLLPLGLGGGDVLTGSGFALNRATRHGGTLSLWSRGAQSRFSGREGALSLGGAVRTTMFGADYAKGRLTAGLSLSHSGGVAEYAGADSGEVVSSVTGLYPWLGYQATDRLSVWGVAGYGSGTLSLTPEGGTALASDLGMALGALGARGELFGAAEYGLAFKADALWVGTSIEGVDGPSGRLKATAAAVTRLRTALEGSRDFRFGSGLSLKPSVEVGVRRDGGDAETGAGLDMGGGVVVTAPSVGLSADVKVRMLLAHEAEEFRERGVSVSLSYNPTPATPFGLQARLSPSWGGQATSGAEALWGRETLSGMARGGFGAAGSRLNANIGYGMPVGRRLVGTPRLAVMTSRTGRDYRLGYGLGVLEGGTLRFELGIDAQRRETPLAGRTNHGVAARATLSW